MLDQWVGRKGLTNLTMQEFFQAAPLLDVMTEKVNTLEDASFAEQTLARDVRLLVELLRATLSRRYQRISILSFAHILVALDYFLRVHDDTPDSQSGGYADDQRVILQVMTQCHAELQDFRDWKLRTENQA